MAVLCDLSVAAVWRMWRCPCDRDLCVTAVTDGNKGSAFPIDLAACEWQLLSASSNLSRGFTNKAEMDEGAFARCLPCVRVDANLYSFKWDQGMFTVDGVDCLFLNVSFYIKVFTTKKAFEHFHHSYLDKKTGILSQ